MNGPGESLPGQAPWPGMKSRQHRVLQRGCGVFFSMRLHPRADNLFDRRVLVWLIAIISIGIVEIASEAGNFLERSRKRKAPGVPPAWGIHSGSRRCVVLRPPWPVAGVRGRHSGGIAGIRRVRLFRTAALAGVAAWAIEIFLKATVLRDPEGRLQSGPLENSFVTVAGCKLLLEKQHGELVS